MHYFALLFAYIKKKQYLCTRFQKQLITKPRKGSTIMANATNYSAYQIFWVEFRATSGIVTKKDIRVLSKTPFIDCKYAAGNKNLLQHFANKQAALDYIETVKEKQNRLGKKYEVRICSDRQFGLSKKEGNFFVIPFTTKQESDMFTIGNKQ